MNKIILFTLGILAGAILSLFIAEKTVIFFGICLIIGMQKYIADFVYIVAMGWLFIATPMYFYTEGITLWSCWLCVVLVCNFIVLLEKIEGILFVNKGDITLFPPEFVPDEVEIDYLY